VAADRYTAQGWPQSAYAVSKIGLTMLTGALARELEAQKDPRGILINAVCPGWVQTRMGGASAPRSVEEGAETPVYLALLPKGGPTGGFFRDKAPADW
jgi:carbonyl reductase 1